MLIAQSVSPGGPLELALAPVAIVACVRPNELPILQDLALGRPLQVLGDDLAPGAGQVALVLGVLILLLVILVQNAGISLPIL